MKNDFEKILNRVSDFRLTKLEKENVRSALFSQIKNDLKTTSNPVNSYGWFIFLSRHTTAAFVVLIMFIGGGTSVVAQKALPGEILYGFKTSLNENVGGWFVKSFRGEVEWELELAERRLEEADLLAKDNRLTQERKDVLKKKFDEHASRVERFIPPEPAIETFSKVIIEDDFSTDSVQIDQLSIRSVETELVAVPEESVAMKASSLSIERDFESEKEEILERISDLKEFIKTSKITREKAIQVRFKLLKAREMMADLGTTNLVEEDIVNSARTLVEEAEMLADKVRSESEDRDF